MGFRFRSIVVAILLVSVVSRKGAKETKAQRDFRRGENWFNTESWHGDEIQGFLFSS